MTLEDISILFGDPVELSFEQALHRETAGKDEDEASEIRHTGGALNEKTVDRPEHVEVKS